MPNSLNSRPLEAIAELRQIIGDLIELQEALLVSTGREDLRQRLDGIKCQFQDHVEGLTKPSSEEAEGEPLRLHQLSVERINIVEADGTLRMTLSNKQLLPDVVVNGKTLLKRDGGNAAGIIFYDDEGSECGGLVYGGSQNADGSYQAGGSLTFDQFRQDQVIGLQHEDANGQRYAGLRVWDRTELPLEDWLKAMSPVASMPDGAAKDEAFQKLRTEGLLGAQRIFVGKHDGNAVVGLFDGNSKARLRMMVDQMGEARIEFLDAEGRVTRTIKASE